MAGADSGQPPAGDRRFRPYTATRTAGTSAVTCGGTLAATRCRQLPSPGSSESSSSGGRHSPSSRCSGNPRILHRERRVHLFYYHLPCQSGTTRGIESTDGPSVRGRSPQTLINIQLAPRCPEAGGGPVPARTATARAGEPDRLSTFLDRGCQPFRRHRRWLTPGTRTSGYEAGSPRSGLAPHRNRIPHHREPGPAQRSRDPIEPRASQNGEPGTSPPGAAAPQARSPPHKALNGLRDDCSELSRDLVAPDRPEGRIEFTDS
jgi:hypothetical protein